ncbi:uncharacterized protein LOC111269680 [Varroa jacobsoni]|uniref:uncharacterized protein LOC111269680 n=1 Tax=Varroa jacobsoni TaxID=62625 RepID=UPI000BF9EDC5|nr:uncharacterized protein LOC111269680 [Varroa jacobsoni]
MEPFVYNEDGAAPEQPAVPVHQHLRHQQQQHPPNSSSPPTELLRQQQQQQQTTTPASTSNISGNSSGLQQHFQPLSPHLHQLQAQIFQSSSNPQILGSGSSNNNSTNGFNGPHAGSLGLGPSKRIQQLLTDPLLLPRKEPNREHLQQQQQPLRTVTAAGAATAAAVPPPGVINRPKSSPALERSPRKERREKGETGVADGTGVHAQRTSSKKSVVPNASTHRTSEPQSAAGAAGFSASSSYRNGDAGGRNFPPTLPQHQQQQRTRTNSINHVLPFLVKQHAKTLLSVQELQERVASLEELSVSLQCAMESSSASVGGCSTINPAHQQSSPWQTSSKAPVTSGNGAAINYSQVVQNSKSSRSADCGGSSAGGGAESDKQDSGLGVDSSSSHSRNSQTPSASGSSQSGINSHHNPHTSSSTLNIHNTTATTTTTAAHNTTSHLSPSHNLHHPHHHHTRPQHLTVAAHGTGQTRVNNPHQNQADELLDLLDQICERGNHLRDFASSQQQLQQLNSDLAGMGDAQLLKENRELKRLLHKTEDEKKALKDQIRAYESQLHRLQGERMAYEDKLSAVCFEKRQLESHVRALHVSCVAGGGGTGTAGSSLGTVVPSRSLAAAGVVTGPASGQGLPAGSTGSAAATNSASSVHPAVNSSHLGSFHDSPSINDKVSRVLQIDNPLELQRQLIEHIMDNAALIDRLRKLEATWAKRHHDWAKTEEALQSHVDDLMGERDECISALRKNQVDLRRLRSRLTFLESAVHKFDGGPTHGTHDAREALDQIDEMEAALPLPPWMQSSSPRLVQSYHNNLAIGLGERKSPHHSLPPRVGVNQAANAHLFRNEGPASLLSNQWRRPGANSPQDLMSVHDDLTSHIDQICSEFDPLSGKEGQAPGATQGHDYDSLDLSMPLQPTKLHSALT